LQYRNVDFLSGESLALSATLGKRLKKFNVNQGWRIMDLMYWIVALWVIVGFIVAVAFGFATEKVKDNDGSTGIV
jgi:hypothetical protein